MGMRGKQRITIGDVEPPFVEPGRDARALEPALSVQMEPLDADLTLQGDHARHLTVAKRSLEGLVVPFVTWDPPERVDWRSQSIVSLSVTQYGVVLNSSTKAPCHSWISSRVVAR